MDKGLPLPSGEGEVEGFSRSAMLINRSSVAYTCNSSCRFTAQIYFTAQDAPAEKSSVSLYRIACMPFRNPSIIRFDYDLKSNKVAEVTSVADKVVSIRSNTEFVNPKT